MSKLKELIDYLEYKRELSRQEGKRGRVLAYAHAADKARSLLAQEQAERKAVPVVKEPSKHYKCPKCHTRFTREYPYKPSDTKEVKEQGEAGLRDTIEGIYKLWGNTKGISTSEAMRQIHNALVDSRRYKAKSRGK